MAMAMEDSHLRSCAVSGGSNIGSIFEKRPETFTMADME